MDPLTELKELYRHAVYLVRGGEVGERHQALDLAMRLLLLIEERS